MLKTRCCLTSVVKVLPLSLTAQSDWSQQLSSKEEEEEEVTKHVLRVEVLVSVTPGLLPAARTAEQAFRGHMTIGGTASESSINKRLRFEARVLTQ